MESDGKSSVPALMTTRLGPGPATVRSPRREVGTPAVTVTESAFGPVPMRRLAEVFPVTANVFRLPLAPWTQTSPTPLNVTSSEGVQSNGVTEPNGPVV